jgi:vacuolar protein sorting-associated protein 13A/C
VAKIIDNIQIKIRNIYIRYEDAFSAPSQGDGKFVMGVLLKEFATFTTAADWKTQIMQMGEELTHKLAKMENFSLFLDYELKSESFSQGKDLKKPRAIDLEKLLKD